MLESLYEANHNKDCDCDECKVWAANHRRFIARGNICGASPGMCPVCCELEDNDEY